MAVFDEGHLVRFRGLGCLPTWFVNSALSWLHLVNLMGFLPLLTKGSLHRQFCEWAFNAKTVDYSRTNELRGLHKLPKLKDEPHLRRISQVTFDAANSGQLKTRTMQMAAQIIFYLYLNAFMTPELFGA